MRQRIIEPEVLDSLPDEHAAVNLADIARINRLTGARRHLLKLLSRRFAQDATFRFLDIGAATGDLALAVQSAFPNAKIVCLDIQFRNLRGAPSSKVQADAFALPFREKSFDVVHNSLFLHHFETEAVGALILEMCRLCRSLVLVQDLHRHWLAYYFLPCTRPVFGWHPVTVSDGMKSVAAGWRRPEIEGLLKNLKLLDHAQIDWHFPSFRYFIAISSTN